MLLVPDACDQTSKQAARTIQRYWAMNRFRAWRKEEMAEANAAAIRIQRQWRVHHSHRWMAGRKVGADEILDFLRVCLRANMVKVGVQKFVHSAKVIQVSELWTVRLECAYAKSVRRATVDLTMRAPTVATNEAFLEIQGIQKVCHDRATAEVLGRAQGTQRAGA